MALSLDFPGKLRVIRTKCLPHALCGIEASDISSTSLLKLHSAFAAAVWSRKMPPADAGAVLTSLDGPIVCDPGFYAVRFRFRMFRKVYPFCTQV